MYSPSIFSSSGVTGGSYSCFGRNGAHGTMANVLYFDGHAETTASFDLVGSDLNYTNAFNTWYYPAGNITDINKGKLRRVDLTDMSVIY